MTSPSSSVKAVKAYMVAQLQSVLLADTTSTALTLGVVYDHPGSAAPSDLVVVGDVRRDIEVNAMVGGEGQWAFQDAYTVDVDVQTFRNTPQLAFERATDLCEAVIAWQRGVPAFGGLLILSRPVSVSQPASEPQGEHKGYVALHTVTFFCRGNY